jgi:hypothetical protein
VTTSLEVACVASTMGVYLAQNAREYVCSDWYGFGISNLDVRVKSGSHTVITQAMHELHPRVPTQHPVLQRATQVKVLYGMDRGRV